LFFVSISLSVSVSVSLFLFLALSISECVFPTRRSLSAPNVVNDKSSNATVRKSKRNNFRPFEETKRRRKTVSKQFLSHCLSVYFCLSLCLTLNSYETVYSDLQKEPCKDIDLHRSRNIRIVFLNAINRRRSHPERKRQRQNQSQ
jgi:hypothetical protein